jgi:NTP pyrophosphatase (non-canonical NTP hydrolase)
MYYLYHIPGKKIGVTRDLNTRVTLVQGYKEGEYEVLEQSDDIDYISDREIELQQSYGYKVDRQKYKNLYFKKLNKMKINPTEQTSTFPVPVTKLKGNLLDNKGLTWRTYHGQFEINDKTIPWILANVKSSMYNDNRCYIYNKAYYEAFIAEPALQPKKEKLYSHHDQFELIREWAKQRGIYENGDVKTQYVKLMEEVGELAKAILKDDKDEFVDAIGDTVVVLTNLATLGGYNIEHCIDSAYGEISNRTGSMVNGTFVKDAD